MEASQEVKDIYRNPQVEEAGTAEAQLSKAINLDLIR